MHRFLNSVPSPVKRRRLDAGIDPPPVAQQHSFLDKGKNRDWTAVRSLLAGAPSLVNVQPLGRWTVLHQAAEAGSADTIGFLLEHGADVTLRTKDGKTPLQVASTDAVRSLLEAAESAAASVPLNGASPATEADAHSCRNASQVESSALGEKSATLKRVWQVQPEALSGTWIDMGEERQALLNDARRAGVTKAMFRDSGRSYILDLDKCTQTDYATGSSCPIRLQNSSAGPSETPYTQASSHTHSTDGNSWKLQTASDLKPASVMQPGTAEPGFRSTTPAVVSHETGKTDGVTSELAPGQSVEVPGSGAKSYTVKNCGGGVWSCTCISWKIQGKQLTTLRSCKHIQKIRGATAEEDRLATSVATVTPSTKQSLTGHEGDQSIIQERFEQQTGKETTSKKTLYSKDSGTDKVAPALLLANKWEERVDPTGWWISEKLDGMRALWDPVKGSLLSRLGNPIMCPKPFLATLPNQALDGELFLGRGRFQELMSLVKNSANIGCIRSWKDVAYVVFDLPEHPGNFEERMKTLHLLLAAAPSSSVHSFARVHEQQLCEGRTHLDEELKRVQAQGGEGLMLRRAGSSYESGRSSSLLKVKTFQDEEAVVIGHEKGKGRNINVVGALRCRNRAGIEFSVGTGLSDAQRANPPKVGEIVTYRFFELTKDNKPRFPSYVGTRADADTTGLKL